MQMCFTCCVWHVCANLTHDFHEHVFPWAALLASQLAMYLHDACQHTADPDLVRLSAPLVCPGFWTVIVISSKVCHMFINLFNLCTVPPALADISTGMRDVGLCH